MTDQTDQTPARPRAVSSNCPRTCAARARGMSERWPRGQSGGSLLLGCTGRLRRWCRSVSEVSVGTHAAQYAAAPLGGPCRETGKNDVSAAS